MSTSAPLPERSSRLYLSPPHVTEAERVALLGAFDANWIAPVGPDLAAFEAELCASVGVPHAVALSSGTAALHLALQLVGVGPGDDVLVSSFTFAASANAVTYLGARPCFVDSEAASWGMDPALLAEELDRRARTSTLPAAVVVVDLYGQCADLDAVAAACDAHGVPLVEDAAEALGARYRGRPAGHAGRAAVFSFNGNKIITTGGGGMLVSHDAELVDRARYLATQARQPVVHYEHTDVGYNYRLSNLLAALGRAQLARLPAIIERRHQIEQAYRAELAGRPGIGFLPVPEWSEPNHWLTVITVDPATAGTDRDQLRLALEAVDAESRPTWKPMHLQPVYGANPMVGGEVSERAFATGLCLPSGSSMTDADVERVLAALRVALTGASPSRRR